MIYRPHTQFRHHHRRAGESPLDWLFSSRSAFSSRLQSLYARYFMYSNRIILDHWSEFPTYLVDMDSTLIAQNVQTYHLCDCQVSVAEHSALPISEFETVFLTKWHLQKVLPFSGTDQNYFFERMEYTKFSPFFKITFHKLVWVHGWDVVGTMTNILLQIPCWIQRWKR